MPRPARRSIVEGVLLAASMLVASPLAACGHGDRDTIFAASSLTDLMPALIEAYHDGGGGGDFDLSLAGSQTLAAQLVEGAPAALFIAANDETATRVVEAGRAVREAPLWQNVLVVAVPAGSSFTTIEALAAPGVRIAIGAPGAPVGNLTNRVLDLIAETDPATAEAIRANVATEDTSVRVALSRVELGEVDAAFVYRTDVEAASNVRAIELPPGMPATRYVAVLLEGAGSEAEAFFEFLRSEGIATARAAGFEPLPAATPASIP